MTKVYLRPDAATIEANNGIGRVVHAQYRYLPQFDIELVGDENQADVIVGHTHDHGAKRIDVCSIHGLYWNGDIGSGVYNTWHTEANTRIVASLRRARAITVPSQWVGECIRRDMRIKPTVIGHGLDLDEWSPGTSGGYVLWAKNRGGDVCNPRWPWELAQRGEKVVATFAPDQLARPASLTVTGALKHAPMRELVRNAEVYLATTKETFGIQTLEAMASGVPVLGFDWGGTADLVRHKETGYLVRPGDAAGLAEGLVYIRAHRARLSAAAREFAQGYAWPAVIEQYARLYHELARTPETHGVAVVIPVYNYGRYLAECVESVLAQTYKPDEVVIVDDGSTDNTLAVARQFEGRGVRVITQPNQGVAAARNNGIAATRSTYVVCIDADDLLAPRYVEACRKALMGDRGLGIAYTGLEWRRPGHRDTSNHWKGGFNWEWQATAQVPPATSIPTGAMFRRTMWERAGGYKQRYAPGEDAEFYTRGLSVGFGAVQITDSPWFVYRDHGGGAHKALTYVPTDDTAPWMRDRHYPLAAPSDVAPPIRSYSQPRVSVIIPAGPGHGVYLPSALDSLLGQTMRDWEAIVVNDSGAALELTPYPFVRVQETTIPLGAGNARNAGLMLAYAPLVLFLDADDALEPDALKVLCGAYAEAGGRYVYGDWREVAGDKIREVESAEYDRIDWFAFDSITAGHVVSVLMATEDARRVGGFDGGLSAWEDWDFFAKCAVAGILGQRVQALTLNVRRLAGSRTHVAFEQRFSLLATLRARYGGQTMGKCCGGNGDAIMAAKLAFQETPKPGGLSIRRTAIGKGSAPRMIDANGMTPIRMQFVGTRSGASTYNGATGSGRQYRGGNNAVNRYANVHPDDVGVLEQSSMWRRVGVQLGEVVPAGISAEMKADQNGPVAELPAVGWSPPVGQVTQIVREPAAALVQGAVTNDNPAMLTPVLAVVAPVDTVVVSKPIQTAEGLVKRKRVVRAAKNTPLKDLPGQ